MSLIMQLGLATSVYWTAESLTCSRSGVYVLLSYADSGCAYSVFSVIAKSRVDDLSSVFHLLSKSNRMNFGNLKDSDCNAIYICSVISS